jgi:hypothetical protein
MLKSYRRESVQKADTDGRSRERADIVGSIVPSLLPWQSYRTI